MLDFIYRLVKGSPLTWSELDGNFQKIADQAITKEELSAPGGSSLVGYPPNSNVKEALDNINSDNQAIESRVDRAILKYSNYSDAEAASGSLANGQNIQVSSDETRNNLNTKYIVSDGVLVFDGLVVDSDSVQAGIRTQSEKNNDTVSVKDYGASGSGISDDTIYFVEAQSSSKWQFVPDGDYIVNGSQVDVSRLIGGPGAVLKFTNGGSWSLGNPATATKLDQIYWQELSPSPGSTLSRNAAPQSLGACGNSIFMSQNVSSPDGIWAPTSVARFAEFPQGRVTSDNWDVTNNTGATAPTGVVDLVGTGHGSGASVIEEGGFRWLYSTVSSVGAPIDGPNCNYGTGFTKTKWQGSGTLQADMREFRGLQGVFGADMCVSVDGKYLVFAGYKFLPVIRETTNYYQTIPWVSVFDRAAVEAAADPSTVAPLHSFKVPSLTNGNLGYGVGAAFAGVACDGSHIYLMYSGAQNVGQRSIFVMNLSGDLLRAMPFSGMAGVAPTDFRSGSGGKASFSYEIEGLTFFRDALFSCTKMNFCTPSTVVSFYGKNFIPTAPSLNVTPSNIGSWARTEMPAIAPWSSSTNYSAPTDLVYHKYVTAIVPSGIYSRPHGMTVGAYIDAPSSLMQGFSDAGILTSDNFYSAKWDRQTETTFPLFDYRSSGIGRLYHTDYMIANPGYDQTSYFGRYMYQYDSGTLISGGPSVATAATLELGNGRNTSSGDRYATLWAQGTRAMLWGVNVLCYKSFLPTTTGLQNGNASFPWASVQAVNLVLTPPASVTPVNNGEVTFELTSNTQLRVRVKGSDGVVRSATLTLA